MPNPKEWYTTYNKRYYAKHREVILPKLRLRNRERRLAARAQVLEHYGARCSCCGETHPEFLSVDHIDGGGRRHRKEISTNNICIWLVRNNFPDGFRLLCHNCNQALGFYRYCPHQLKSGTQT